MKFAYAANTSRTLARSGLRALRDFGPVAVARLAFSWATFPLWRHEAARRRGTFRLGGHDYSYFLHNTNVTWCNERAVEIPVAHAFLVAGARTLEVGNVLSHYGVTGHDVVDCYERAPGVFQTDVVDFRPGVLYDRIVSISTLEHVGFDETPLDPSKPIRALDHLTSLLAPGGALLVTLPTGYNPHLDARLADGSVAWSDVRGMSRSPGGTVWTEVPLEVALAAPYGAGGPGATGLVLGWRKAQ